MKLSLFRRRRDTRPPPSPWGDEEIGTWADDGSAVWTRAEWDAMNAGRNEAETSAMRNWLNGGKSGRLPEDGVTSTNLPAVRRQRAVVVHRPTPATTRRSVLPAVLAVTAVATPLAGLLITLTEAAR